MAFMASNTAACTMAMSRLWRLLTRSADTVLTAIVFQSVTTSARTVAEKPISASSATPSLLAAATRRPACDSWFRVIFRLPLFKTERTAPMALTMGPEREVLNAQQRNCKSTVDNLRSCAGREGFCAT
jgi:hypothetical protein